MSSAPGLPPLRPAHSILFPYSAADLRDNPSLVPDALQIANSDLEGIRQYKFDLAADIERAKEVSNDLSLQDGVMVAEYNELLEKAAKLTGAPLSEAKADLERRKAALDALQADLRAANEFVGTQEEKLTDNRQEELARSNLAMAKEFDEAGAEDSEHTVLYGVDLDVYIAQLFSSEEFIDRVQQGVLMGVSVDKVAVLIRTALICALSGPKGVAKGAEMEPVRSVGLNNRTWTKFCKELMSRTVKFEGQIRVVSDLLKEKFGDSEMVQTFGSVWPLCEHQLRLAQERIKEQQKEALSDLELARKISEARK